MMPFQLRHFRTAIGFALLLVALAPGEVARASQAASQDRVEAQQLLGGERYGQAVPVLRRMIETNPGDAWAVFQLGYALHALGRLDEAIEMHRRASAFPEFRPTALYNLMCAQALDGRPDEAFQTLEDCFAAGFTNLDDMAVDPDLESLRADPRWRAAVPHEFRMIETPDGTTLVYAVVLPADYDPQKACPTLVGFAPGSGNRSAVETAQVLWWGRQAHAAGWIVISPVQPTRGWTTDAGRAAIGALLDHVAGVFKVEGDRFHVAGCSGGGPGAFATAIAFADRCASLTGLPAYPVGADAGRLQRLADAGVVVRLMVGEHDRSWRESMRQTHEKLVELGVDSRLEVFPGERHVIGSLNGSGLMTRLQTLRRDRPSGFPEVAREP